jgi:hypothetical protein
MLGSACIVPSLLAACLSGLYALPQCHFLQYDRLCSSGCRIRLCQCSGRWYCSLRRSCLTASELCHIQKRPGQFVFNRQGDAVAAGGSKCETGFSGCRLVKCRVADVRQCEWRQCDPSTLCVANYQWQPWIDGTIVDDNFGTDLDLRNAAPH